MLGLGQEVGNDASIKLLLSDYSALEQSFSGVIEGSVEEGEEGSGFGREDLLLGVVDSAMDGNTLVESLDVSHDEDMRMFVASMQSVRREEKSMMKRR